MSWRLFHEWVRLVGPRLENYVGDYPGLSAKPREQTKAKTKAVGRANYKSRRQPTKKPGLSIDERSSETRTFPNSTFAPAPPSPKNSLALSVKIYEFLHILVNAHPKSEIVGAHQLQMVARKEFLDQSASRTRLFALDQEYIERNYNIDCKIQNFYDSVYDFKNLVREFAAPMLERQQTGPVSRRQLQRQAGEAELRARRMKQLDQNMLHIRRQLVRLEQGLSARRCTSSEGVGPSNSSSHCQNRHGARGQKPAVSCARRPQKT